MAEIQRLKVGHAEDLLTRDKENHYLSCQLGEAGADNLETFNKLIVNDIAEGWTSFDDLPVLKNMSSAQVEWKFRVRGYAHSSAVGRPENPGVPVHTQILADQLTLFQPGGTDFAHLITTGTPGFSDLPTALHSI